MRTIKYKYNVGDKVMFKEEFVPSASIGLKELAGQTATVVERKDYGGPAYRLDGHDGFFKQGCFAGLAI